MDNDTFLFWVEYMLGPKQPRVETYDSVVEGADGLLELSQNVSLMEHLRDVLVIDREFMDFKKSIAEARRRSYFGGSVGIVAPQIRRMLSELAEIDTRRQAAYEDYEMFRKLTVGIETPDLYKIKLR